MDVAAKLGIIVDAAGARHEVMLTTAQLKGLSDGGKEAAAVMKELGIGLDDAGTKSDQTTPKVNALAASITRMRASAAQRLDLGLSRQIAELDPFRLRTEQGAMATTKLATAMERMRAAGRQKADLGLATQIEQLDPFQKKLAGVDEAAGHGRLSIGRLGNAVADLGAHLTGVHPILGKVVEVVGMFAVGHALTLGVITGITLIALAWDKYSEKVRKATEEQNKLVASSMEALRTRALGPGGEFANIATAAQGRISDLQTERAEATSIMGRNIVPSEQRERLRAIDSEISQLQLLTRDSMRNLDLAKAKQFAESITTPFDYAVARGESILGFYNEAIASQRQLNDLAKSGDFATRTAAIQGLQQIQHVLDQIELQKKGLAERPSTTLGLPSQVVVPGLQQTSGAIGGAFKQLSTLPVELLHRYENEINDLEGTINRFQIQAGRALGEHKDDWSATGQAIRQAAKDAQTYYDAVQIALHPERAGAIGAGIRGAQRDNGAMAFVQGNEQYGAQMAAREAALKLPPVFDAVREASVRHGEAERQLTNEIAVSREAWKDTDTAIGSFKEGVLGAAASISQALSPTAIAQGVVSTSHQMLSQFFQDAVTTGVDSFRKLFGGVRDMVLKVLSDIASARILEAIGDKLGLLTPSVVMNQAATKNVGAATTMLAASNAMVLAANVMADAAGVPRAPGGGAGGGAPAAGGGGAASGGGGAFGGLGWMRAGGAGVAGGLIGYGIGQSTTNKTYGGLGGAAGGALAGFAIGGPVGAAIGGITGFVGGILGSGKAAREAAKEMHRLQDQLKLTMDQFRAQIKGDDLAIQIASARAALITLLKQINDAYPGKKNEDERNRQRAEAQALEAQQEQQLRQADAQRRKEASEDLKVRLLRAQGQDAAADALALANSQQREYNQAVKDGADAAYLAMLTQVQAAEKTKAAMDSLQDSIRNAPTGFRPEDYGLGQVMPVGGGVTLPTTTSRPGIPMINPFLPPRQVPVDQTQGAAPTTAVIYVNMPAGAVLIDGRENPDMIASKAVAGFRRFAAGSIGPNAPLAKAIELMPANHSVS
jgi:hypothetical protein